MRTIILAAGLAVLFPPLAFAQPAESNDGLTRPGTTVPDTTVPELREQDRPPSNPGQQFGTGDPRNAPNASCPPGSTRAECRDRKTPAPRPGVPADPGAGLPPSNPGEQGSGG